MPLPKNRSSPKDILYIEDEKARIKVDVPAFEPMTDKEETKKERFDLEDFVTGTVLALKYLSLIHNRGRICVKGSNVTFRLEDICAAGYPAHANKVMIPTTTQVERLLEPKRKRLVAFVSGLEVQADQGLFYDKLYQFVDGHFGDKTIMDVTWRYNFFIGGNKYRADNLCRELCSTA